MYPTLVRPRATQIPHKGGSHCPPRTPRSRTYFIALAHFGRLCWSPGPFQGGESVPRLNGYLRIRNWEAVGKIAIHRYPINDYRLFRVSDLDKLLRKPESSARSSKPKELRFEAR